MYLLREKTVGACIFFGLFLAAALKSGSVYVGEADQSYQVLTHPLVELLRSTSPAVLLISCAAPLLLLLRRGPVRWVAPSGPAVALLCLTVLSAFRAVYVDFPSAGKLLQAAGLYSVVIFATGRLVAAVGPDRFYDQFVAVVRTFAMCLISLNFLVILTGGGYSLGNPRLYGTAEHPNFLGVQLAIANLVLLFSLLSLKRILVPSGALFAAALAAGLYLQISTGSRTSFAVFGSGALIIMLATNRYRPPLFLLAAIPLAAIAYFWLMDNPDIFGSVFDRGPLGANTRADAWSEMLSQIADEPWLGRGYFYGASENSYLRSMSAFGIPYGLAFTALLGIAAVQHGIRSVRLVSSRSSARHLSFALFGALLAGGFLEGYLMDSWSVPKLALVSLLAMTTAPQRSSGLARNLRVDQ